MTHDHTNRKRRDLMNGCQTCFAHWGETNDQIFEECQVWQNCPDCKGKGTMAGEWNAVLCFKANGAALLAFRNLASPDVARGIVFRANQDVAVFKGEICHDSCFDACVAGRQVRVAGRYLSVNGIVERIGETA